jgi:uncharacterized membrane protein
MGAGLMIITVGLAAFAVDMGYVYARSRELQGTADLAAMSAAANLSTAESAAQDVVMANARGDAIAVTTQIIRTAQARLYLDVSLVPGIIGVSLIHVPLYIELALAQGKLSNISRNSNKSLNSVTLALSPGIGEASIGTVNTVDLSNFKKTLVVSPAQLVAIPLVGGVSAQSQIMIGGTTWQNATFSASDIAKQTVKTVRINDAVTSIGSSLISHTQLTPNVLGLGIGLNLVTATLGNLIAGLGPVLDPVINALLDQLGVGLARSMHRSMVCAAPARPW